MLDAGEFLIFRTPNFQQSGCTQLYKLLGSSAIADKIFVPEYTVALFVPNYDMETGLQKSMALYSFRGVIVRVKLTVFG